MPRSALQSVFGELPPGTAWRALPCRTVVRAALWLAIPAWLALSYGWAARTSHELAGVGERAYATPCRPRLGSQIPQIALAAAGVALIWLLLGGGTRRHGRWCLAVGGVLALWLLAALVPGEALTCPRAT